MATWYFVENGSQQGPLDEKQLQQLVLAGRIRPETRLWREGMPDWREARAIRGVEFGLPAPPTRTMDGEPSLGVRLAHHGGEDASAYTYTEAGLRRLFFYICAGQA